MPFYVWTCNGGGQHENQQTQTFSTIAARQAPTCERCSQAMERDFMAEARPQNAANGFPLTTTHIDGTPRTFDDPAAYNRALKEKGLILRDDPGFLDDEVVTDWVMGPRGNMILAPVMKRGSGRGHKGQWI